MWMRCLTEYSRCFAREAEPGVNEHNPDTRSVGIECMSERTPKERMTGGVNPAYGACGQIEEGSSN